MTIPSPPNQINCLIAPVGKQPMPILIPILQYQPQETWLIYTRETQSVAEAIGSVCKRRGLAVRLFDKVVNPYSSDETAALCNKKIETASGEVVINNTGGTTPMNLGAFRAAHAHGKAMLYVNTDDGLILWLDAEGRETGVTDRVQVNVTVEAYIQVHNAKVTSMSNTAWDERFRSAAEHLGLLGTECMPLMDQARRQANDRSYAPSLPQPTRRQVELASKLDELHIVQDVNVSSSALAFRIADGEKTGNFLNGIWLELHVADRLVQSGRFDDVMHSGNVQKRLPENGPWIGNQLDVLVTKNGRLTAISCKTSAMPNSDQKFDLYELDALLKADEMGLYSQKMYLTSRDPGSLTRTFRNRAALSQICIITGDQLTDVTQPVAKFMRV